MVSTLGGFGSIQQHEPDMEQPNKSGTAQERERGMARKARRKAKRRPYWKEPVVIGAVVVAIVLVAAVAAAMFHFSKPQKRHARKDAVVARTEPPPTIEIRGAAINLDELGWEAYADLLSQVQDEPELLDKIEHALAQSVRDGREKSNIESFPDMNESTVTYPSRLRQRLERAALLGATKGSLRAATWMELGVFEFYRGRNAEIGKVPEDVAVCPFADAYTNLGLTEGPQGGYHAAIFFFTKAIKGFDPNDQWRESNIRRGMALAGIAVILRAWGDRASAIELLEKATEIHRAMHNSADVAKTRTYIEAMLAEGPIQSSPESTVAAEIKEKLGPAQRMP